MQYSDKCIESSLTLFNDRKNHVKTSHINPPVRDPAYPQFRKVSFKACKTPCRELHNNGITPDNTATGNLIPKSCLLPACDSYFLLRCWSNHPGLIFPRMRTLIEYMCPLYVSMSSTNVTITVDRELKKKMEELKQVNWSRVARMAFEEEIKKEKRRRITNEIKAIREKDTSNWSGSEEIRKWRDARK